MDANQIHDFKPMMVLCGTMFNLSDNFLRRSSLVQSGDKFNAAQLIYLTGVLSPLSWDSLEGLDNKKPGIGSNWSSRASLCELPTLKKYGEMLSLLKSLISNALLVLSEKIDAAKSENSEQNKQVWSFIENHNDPFEELDLISEMNFEEIPQDLKQIQQEEIKSFFRHEYFRMLTRMCIYYQTKLDEFRLEHAKLTTSPMSQQKYYQIYFNLLKIADLYVEIRKIGRWFYFDNFAYFSQFARVNRTLRLTLNEITNYFSNNKQNTLILSTISKYSKRTLTSVNQTNPKEQFNQMSSIFILDAKKSSKQMFDILHASVESLKQLCDEWNKVLAENREHTFSQDKLRAQMKQRDVRNRQSLVINTSASMTSQTAMRNAMNRKSVLPSPTGSRSPSLPGSRSGSRNSSRASSLNQSSELAKKMAIQSTSIQQQQQQQQEPMSTEQKRKMSLTSSSKSPFYKPPSRTPSRTNSLNSGSSILRPPQKTVLNDEITPLSSPLKSSSQQSITPDSKASPTLQRRHSVIVSPTRPRQQLGQPPKPQQTDLRRRSSIIGNISSASSSNSSIGSSASSNASEVNSKPLTAQQRLQQHILKSQRNGTVLAKPLQQNRRVSSPQAKSASPPPPLKLSPPQPNGSASISSSKKAEPPADVSELGIDLNSPPSSTQAKESNFPSGSNGAVSPISPLNSLRGSGSSSQAALLAVQRSRSNSNLSQPQQLQVPVIRSRAGSASNTASSSIASSANRSRAGSVTNSTGGQLSRRGSVMRSRGDSTASNRSLQLAGPSKPKDYGGNTQIYDPLDDLSEKKVRFVGVSPYTEDEDAHTADRMRKQMRQKWAGYKPLFRKLNSQEGQTLREFKQEERRHTSGTGGFLSEAVHNMETGRGVSMMAAAPSTQFFGSGMNAGSSSGGGLGTKRLSKLFGRR